MAPPLEPWSNKLLPAPDNPLYPPLRRSQRVACFFPAAIRRCLRTRPPRLEAT